MGHDPYCGEIIFNVIITTTIYPHHLNMKSWAQPFSEINSKNSKTFIFIVFGVRRVFGLQSSYRFCFLFKILEANL